MNKFQLLRSLYKTETKMFYDSYKRVLFEVLVVYYPTGAKKQFITEQMQITGIAEMKSVINIPKMKIEDVKINF